MRLPPTLIDMTKASAKQLQNRLHYSTLKPVFILALYVSCLPLWGKRTGLHLKKIRCDRIESQFSTLGSLSCSSGHQKTGHIVSIVSLPWVGVFGPQHGGATRWPMLINSLVSGLIGVCISNAIFFFLKLLKFKVHPLGTMNTHQSFYKKNPDL